MKKLLGIVLGLVAILAIAVVVLPGVIDWNDYKGTIQAQLKGLTGRDVVIGGDIHIAVLPAPALIANGVRMANLKGAGAADMIRLKSVEVRIALGPLLGGNVEVETIKLVDPIVELERLADGRTNWEFAPVRTENDGSTSAPLPGFGAGEAGSGTAIRLDSFHIENGTIIYRDARSGTVERIERLEARLTAESPTGPFDSAGRLDFRGIPLGYELSVGRVINERTVPLNMAVVAEPGDARAEISGAIVELAEAPKFKGKVIASGKMLSDLLAAVGGGASPAFFAQPFGASGDVTVSAQDLSVKHLAVSLGALRADGELTANLAESPIGFTTKLTMPKVDLDALLAPPQPKPAATPADDPEAARDITVGPVAKPKAPAPTAPAFALPQNVNGTVELTAETITYRGNIISDARATADLHGGEVTLSQFTAQLPGGSDVFVTGFLTAQDGAPKFDGTLDAKVSDLRRVVAWLGGEVPGIASDRLRKATVKGRIVADPEQVQGLNLDMMVDSSRITGGITLALRQRLAFGASFTVDRLNLDAYLSPNGAPPAADAATATPQSQPSAGPQPEPSFALPDFLNRFDANLKLQVERLTYRQVPVNDLVFDGTLFGGNLDLRRAAIGDLAGASASLSGALSGLNLLPSVKNGRFEARGIDVDRLSRLLETPVPVSTRDLGVVEITGGIEGSLLRPQVDLAAKTPEAAVELKGRLSVLPVESLFAGDVTVRHGDFARLLGLFGVNYRPAGRPGDVGLSATVKADAKRVAISQLDGKVGAATLAGTLNVDLAGPRPRLTGDLKAGRVVVDPFLPAQRSAALVPRIIPAAWVPAKMPAGEAPRLWPAAATAGRWSTAPLDLAVLSAFDADLKLAGEAVVYDGIMVRDVAADTTVTEGVLRIPALSGILFGGALKGDVTLKAGPKPALDGTLSLTGGDFGTYQEELEGKRLATGDIAFSTAVNSSGASVAEMVSGLKGEGSFEVKKAALSGDSGKPRGPIAALLSGLNQLAGLGGDQRPEGQADISGSFKIDRGIARSEDLRLVSTVGEGKGKGTVDLPKWTMKVDSDIQLSQNLFAKLLSGTTGVGFGVPLRIEGDIDQPNVVLDVAKLPGKALSIPGSILQNSAPSKILRKLIPGAD
ncbi:AsmA family protein [Shumkonia mesophila]|uniref:AsmA family protein n=1 Tax=Shumkonia mesophila TaxID=2838854 RepID=UPI0029342DE7|nr:AsmA family protein [Shumkonia mesophila]